MELSAVVKKYNLSLTRSESNLVGRLSGGTSEQAEQRMKALAEARDVLKQLPDRQTSERRSRMEKAAMLKERLKMLRQMLPFLSPSAAKSLKSEMKQIAGQIASLSSGSGGGGSITVTTDAPATGTAESAQGAETAQDAGPSLETDQGDNKNQQERYTLSGAGLSGQEVRNDVGVNAEERALRETVTELKALFRGVLEALKRKQQAGRATRNLASASPLRVYAAMPDSGGRVAINV
jgi:hypothetical protein